MVVRFTWEMPIRECCHQKSRRSGGRDESLLVQTSDQCSGAPSCLFVKIMYWPLTNFYIFTNPNVCPTQPNLTFTIVQQYDYAKHDYFVSKIRHGLDYSCYYTIQKITWWWERAEKCEEVHVKAKSIYISPKASYHPSQNCLIYGASSILPEK